MAFGAEPPFAAGSFSSTYLLTKRRSGRNAYQATNTAISRTGTTIFQILFFITPSPFWLEILGSCGSIPAVENAALVIGVRELCPIRSYTAARSKKDLGRDQHAHGWCNEIEPKGVPVTHLKCGTKG